jgi:thiamine kinase-like enzyme
MDCIEDTLSNLFRGVPNLISKIECYNRNSISFYSVGDKKILLKQYNEKKFAEREKFFYELLDDVCRIPKVYGFGEDYLVTEYIESSNPDLKMAVEDWAKVHSVFLESEILKNSDIPKHKLRNLSNYVLNHKRLFGEISDKLSKRLSDKSEIVDYTTIIHGDLFGRNILSRNGENYYIDFEFSGVGNPIRDLSLLLLNHPSMERELIESYRKNISFDYDGIEKDINNELLDKGVQLIAGLGNLRMPSEGKKKIYRKFLEVLKNHLD